MINFLELIENNIMPLCENSTQWYGYREKGINYCVTSHFKNDSLLSDKVAHMLIDDLNSSVISKKSDESSVGLDIDKDET